MRYYNIEHLPRPKRAQVQKIVRVIRDAATVEMIVLFGSHANEDWVEDRDGGYISDFDILVLVEDAPLAADFAFWQSLQESAQSQSGDSLVHLVVHDIGYVNGQLAKGADFFREIVEEGIVLYDSGRHRLFAESGSQVSTSAQEARARFDWHFRIANRWLDDFENEFRQGDLNLAAFKLHLAVELFCKTVLRVLTGSQPKVHDLFALLNQCSRLDPVFRDVVPRTNAVEKRRLRLLDRAYRDARYEMSYSISREDLEILGGHVRALRDRVESVCREFIRKHPTDPRPAA